MDAENPNLDPDVKMVLQAIKGFDNIPRKRAKFINFCKNALPGGKKCHPATIEKTWEEFEKALKDPTTSKGKEEKSSINKENGSCNGIKATDEDVEMRDGVPMFKGTKKSDQNDDVKQKRTKRKLKEDKGDDDVLAAVKKAKVDDDTFITEEKSSKFDWIECISSVIEKKGPTKWNKLKKKVVNEFVKQQPHTAKSRIDLETKFEKKVNKCKKFKVSNDIVEFSTSRA